MKSSGRTPEQILADLDRTEPKTGAAVILLRWLTRDALKVEYPKP